MNKFITFIIPYIIAALSFVTSIVDIEIKEELLAIAVGCLMCLWYIFIHKTEGTKGMIILMTLTFFILVAADVLAALFYFPMLTALTFTTIIQLFALYVVSQNKPSYAMTYQYSYKNNKRRFF